MKLFCTITTLYLSFQSVFGGCHTGQVDHDKPTLGIETTAAGQWSGMAEESNKFFANVFTNGAWQGWKRLDNRREIDDSNCDDFYRGATDYFDDFEDVTDRWGGISFFNCGGDGVRIENVWCWDGSSWKDKMIGSWRAGVFGPFGTACLYNDNTRASDTNPNLSYGDINIDGLSGDQKWCRGVTFETPLTGNQGRVWTGKLPGIPNCRSDDNNGYSPASVSNHDYEPVNDYKYIPMNNGVYTDFEQQLLNYLMAAIGIGLILFVSNSCLITMMVKNHTQNGKQNGYGKVSKYDSEA